MIAEALLGIAAGAWLAGGLAGLREPRHWTQAARLIAALGVLLTTGAAAVTSMAAIPTLSTQAALAASVIIAGGAVLAFRAEIAAETLLVGGLAPACMMLAGARDTPVSVPWLVALLTGSLTLPAIDGALRELRRLPVRTHVSSALWIGISLALAVQVALNVSRRGLWIEATPGGVWLLSAWIAASAGRLTRPGRPRAALVSTAALALAISALGG